MSERFPNLYDRDRWHRFGYPFMLLVLVGLVVGIVYGFQHNTNAKNDWLLAAACGLGLATSLWMRQRWSYVQLQGDQILFRVFSVSVRLDLAEVRRSRPGKLVAALDGRARPPRSMATAEALVLRLRTPDSGRLRRVLGRRCVFGEEVVVPIANPGALSREIEAVLGPQREARDGAAGHVASRRRRRRK